MAFVKIRGQQIQDATLKNQHIAADAAIHESKLDIDWAARSVDVLSSKKVVDFIQVNGQDVSGVDQFDLSAAGLLLNSVASTTSDPLDVEGVIVSGTKNIVPLRDASTGEPVLSVTDAEVYGRMEKDGVSGNFVVKFFSMETGVETAFVMPAGMVIDFQFAQRFNLQSVNEMFAANEKFVEGSADATAHLNIEQLAKDLYGATFALDRDGNANLSRSLVDEILVQTRGLTNTAVRANNIIDEVVAGRGSFGSLSARFSDIDNKITSINSKDSEQDGRLDALEAEAGASNDEIIEARSSVLTGAHATLDERLEAAEQKFNTDIANEASARSTADTTLQSNIDAENTRAVGEEARIEGKVDQEVLDRQAADTTLQGNIDTVAGNLSSYQTSNDARSTQIEADLAQEVTDRGTAVAGVQTNLDNYKTANDTRVAAVEAKDVEQDGRLDNIEAKDIEQDGRLDAVEAKDVEQDGRLDSLESSLQTSQNDALGIFKFTFQAVGGESVVNLPVGRYFVKGDDSLDVFLNGMLQTVGLHYSEVADGTDATKGIGIDFAPETLVTGDIVTFKYSKKSSLGN